MDLSLTHQLWLGKDLKPSMVYIQENDPIKFQTIEKDTTLVSFISVGKLKNYSLLYVPCNPIQTVAYFFEKRRVRSNDFRCPEKCKEVSLFSITYRWFYGSWVVRIGLLFLLQFFFWLVIKFLSTVSDDWVAPIFLSTWKTIIGNPIFYLNLNSYLNFLFLLFNVIFFSIDFL